MSESPRRRKPGLRLVLGCFGLALVMAILGFGGLAGAFIDIAQILFWLALIIAAILFVLGYTIYKKVT